MCSNPNYPSIMSPLPAIPTISQAATPTAVSSMATNPYSLSGQPVSDSSSAPMLLGVCGVLLFINTLLLVARAWTRIRPVFCLSWDDWTIFAAGVLCAADYFCIVAASVAGLGHPRKFVSFQGRLDANRLIFISQVLWYWSVLFIKVSVASLLLRVKRREKIWRYFLISIIVLMVVLVITQTANQFLQCRPFAIFWDPRLFRTVKCWHANIINLNIIIFSVWQVLTDLIFSLIPIAFISTLNRPRREKIIMCILMALGIFASGASIIRTLKLRDFYKTKDLFQLNATISFWALVEQQLGLLAATIPTLKAFFEKCLIRLGLFFYDAKSETEVRSALVHMGFLDQEFQPERRDGVDGVDEKPKSTPASSTREIKNFF